jgi:uncharacterized protein YqgC (DUF456 family)
MTVTILLFILAAVLVVAGVAGVVFPALPGLPLVFAGLVVAAWAEGFTYVATWTIVILAVLTAGGLAVDFAASALGAKRVGASRQAVIGATLGALVGLFFGIAGILLGPFFGAVIGELLVRRDLLGAGRAGFGTWLGIALGAAAKLAIALSMIGIFVLVRVWGGL